ncbi:MAG: GNAT family N-acetyltransferase [Thermoleophilia bacterium]
MQQREARDVILRDGATLRLHQPGPAEAPALLSLFERLTPESLRSRFHGLPAIGESLVAPFVDPDGVERGTLVGTLGDDDHERVVAIGSWARLRDESAAEVAFVVEDREQGRGIGTRLLEQMAIDAGRVGVERFVAEVLPENRRMLHVFEGAGFDVVRSYASGEVEVRFPIAATAEYVERVDQRDHEGVVASLAPLFRPCRVAVVGASPRRGSIGGELFRNVLAGGFAGEAFPINRDGQPVAGVHAETSIRDLPGPVDLAVICVPGEAVLDVAGEALAAGARALCVVSAGFAETGREGAARQEQLLALVRRHGVRLVGPNCLGVAVSECGLNATFAPRQFPAGRIGFASQSGALGLALLEAAGPRGLGVSSFVSIGNKADVSTNDLLEWWEDDPATALVLLYVESFGNPRKFSRIARRVARRKPVLGMKAGRSRAGARAASSHTAALAGSDAAVDALFRQAGVIRAQTLEELLDVAALLSSQPLPHGRRAAVVTNAGGLGILCADACETAGIELPSLAPETRAALAPFLPREASLANPVDLLGSATAQTYEAALPVLLRDPNVDALVVLFVPPVVAGVEEVAAAIGRAAEAAADEQKPVLASLVAAEGVPAGIPAGARSVPTFAYPESAARALGRAVERAEWLRRAAGATPELNGIDRERAQAIVAAGLNGSTDVWLDAVASVLLLEAYGIPTAPIRLAATPDEAAAAARQVGFPCAVKLAEPGAHKSDRGGVVLDVADQASARAAAAQIGEPVLVQPMVAHGVELLAGVVQDPVFGPLVAFGPGGVLAELVGDASFRLAPLTDVDARELVRGGRAGRLVRGFRGAEPADEDALVDILLRLSRLGEDLPELAELDLNPVLARPDGAIAVDVRIRVRAVEQSRRLKTW